MANTFINLYGGNPTGGLSDGTIISTDGTQTAPLVITLDAAQNEVKKQKLAIRCEEGYAAMSGTIIQDNNDTNDHWKFSLTENGVYEDSITIASGIDTGNSIFWAQASSSSLESPSRDTSVSIRVNATIEAVS